MRTKPQTVEIEVEITRSRAGMRGRKKRAGVGPSQYLPRISRLMALTVKFQEMIDRGEVRDYADLARLGFVTRARLTQIMNLSLLAPDIQEHLLSLPRGIAMRETQVRRIVGLVEWDDQRRLFQSLAGPSSKT